MAVQYTSGECRSIEAEGKARTGPDQNVLHDRPLQIQKARKGNQRALNSETHFHRVHKGHLGEYERPKAEIDPRRTFSG